MHKPIPISYVAPHRPIPCKPYTISKLATAEGLVEVSSSLFEPFWLVDYVSVKLLTCW
ncbi:hypothetical protein Hanom_Chr14g01295551 [Helianthus anomalus]